MTGRRTAGPQRSSGNKAVIESWQRTEAAFVEILALAYVADAALMIDPSKKKRPTRTNGTFDELLDLLEGSTPKINKTSIGKLRRTVRTRCRKLMADIPGLKVSTDLTLNYSPQEGANQRQLAEDLRSHMGGAPEAVTQIRAQLNASFSDEGANTVAEWASWAPPGVVPELDQITWRALGFHALSRLDNDALLSDDEPMTRELRQELASLALVAEAQIAHLSRSHDYKSTEGATLAATLV